MSRDQNHRARAMGFADAATLGAVVQIGHHVRSGRQITNAQVDALARAYPAIPREAIHERAVAVNALPAGQRFNAFATEVGGPDSVREATALVDSYSKHYAHESTVDKISDRIDARRPEADKALQVADKPRAGGDLRDALGRQLDALNGRGQPQTKHELRGQVIDKLERSAAVLGATERHSLRDTVDAAATDVGADAYIDHFGLNEPDEVGQGA